MIPEGNYKARGTSYFEGESSQKKTPCAYVSFVITQDCPQKGQIVEWAGYLTDGTQDRTAQSLVLCGYDGTDPKTIGTNEVLLVIQHEEFTPEATQSNPSPQPQKRARVAWINDPNRGGGGVVPLEGAKLEEVRSKLRGLIFAKREEMAKKAAASGDAASFPFGANANGQQAGAPPPAQQSPPAAAKAPPRF